MILSRVWYVLLGLAVAVALYVVYVAVGQSERQATRSLKEGLASDSQTVEWALKIDGRRRLDALLAGSVDGTLQQALVAANGTKDGKVPEKSKADAKKALTSLNDAIKDDRRDDVLFAVNRDGAVVAQVGYDIIAGNDDFELGGYPVVNDALHGFVRDDVWVLGAKMYVVVARPVEYDATQRPAGAVVGLKEVNAKFADDLAKRTRTNVAFFASAGRMGSGVGVDGFDPEKLDAIGSDLKGVTYGDSDRSEVRTLTPDLFAMYTRVPGDAWALGGAFAVVRSKTPLGGPMGFLSKADDKDKANVPWALLVVVVLGAAIVGVAFTLIEHTLPLRELVMQAERLKTGVMDSLQVARFRGSYRLAAQSLNQGMERSIEKAGGVTRKPADLESILGPTPAQPSMSAFSFPLSDGAPNPPSSARDATPAGGPLSAPFTAPAPPSSKPLSPTLSRPTPPVFVPSVQAPAPPPPQAGPPRPGSRPGAPPLPAGGAPPLPASPKLAPAVTHPGPMFVPSPAPPATPSTPLSAEDDDDAATMVGAVPAELLAQAAGAGQDDSAEWFSVYEDFIRTKRQCSEPTDGLSFEKFSHTLKKNRDQLIQKHNCRRVKFSVYVKEGRASLKATPVRD